MSSGVPLSASSSKARTNTLTQFSPACLCATTIAPPRRSATLVTASSSSLADGNSNGINFFNRALRLVAARSLRLRSRNCRCFFAAAAACRAASSGSSCARTYIYSPKNVYKMRQQQRGCAAIGGSDINCHRGSTQTTRLQLSMCCANSARTAPHRHTQLHLFFTTPNSLVLSVPPGFVAAAHVRTTRHRFREHHTGQQDGPTPRHPRRCGTHPEQ